MSVVKDLYCDRLLMCAFHNGGALFILKTHAGWDTEVEKKKKVGVQISFCCFVSSNNAAIKMPKCVSKYPESGIFWFDLCSQANRGKF